MLIICKSCKKIIDTDKHDFCPKCGSNFNYGDNLTVTNHTEDYEEYERRMAEQQRAAVENRMSNTKQATKKETQRRLKNQAKQVEGKKNGCSGCIGLFVLIVFGFGVLSGIIEEGDIDLDELFGDEYSTPAQVTTEISADIYIPEYTQGTEDDYSEEDDDNPDYFILAGETAETGKYSLTCTEVAEYENSFIPPNDGYKYISFTFVVKNTTDSTRYYYESPTCVAGGEERGPVAVNGIFFPGQLDAGQTYEKSVVFEVPNEEVFFDIYYGNDVVIFTSVADIEDYDWSQE